jgi:hypothetical protein
MHKEQHKHIQTTRIVKKIIDGIIIQAIDKSINENNSNVNNILLRELPTELQLIILKFYGGDFFSIDKQQNIISFDEFISCLIKNYYGRCRDNLIYFLYPYCDVYGNSFREQSCLLSLLKHSKLSSTWLTSIVGVETTFTPNKDKKSGYKQEVTKVCSILERAKLMFNQLTELDLVQVKLRPDIIDEILKHTPNIKSIYLGGFDSKPHNELVELVAKLVHLEKITWTGSGLDEINVKLFAQKLHSIKKLSIQSRWSIGQFSDLFQEWKHLESVSITFGFDHISYWGYNNRGGRVSYDKELSAFKALRNIEKLNTFHLERSEQLIPASINMLYAHPVLSTIEIAAPLCTEAFTVFSSLPNLKILLLGSSGYCNSDLAWLTKSNTLLVLGLHLSHNFGDDGCNYISQIKSLRSVWIAPNVIHDKGGIMLSELTDLEEIDFRCSKISVKTVQRLAKNCKKLKYIYIDGCDRIDFTKFSDHEKKYLQTIGLDYSFKHINRRKYSLN